MMSVSISCRYVTVNQTGLQLLPNLRYSLSMSRMRQILGRVATSDRIIQLILAYLICLSMSLFVYIKLVVSQSICLDLGRGEAANIYTLFLVRASLVSTQSNMETEEPYEGLFSIYRLSQCYI